METSEDILRLLADRLKWENKFTPADVALSTVPEGGQVPFPQEGVTSPAGAKMLSPIEKRNSSLENLPIPSIPEEETGVIVELLKEEGSLAQEEIFEFTGLEPAKLPVLLLQLELVQKIRRTQEGRYSLFC